MELIGGIEAGGTKIVLALARTDGAIVARERLETGAVAETMPRVVAFFRERGAAAGHLRAIGVGSFGPVDIDPASPHYGTITTTPKPGWSSMSYCDWLGSLGVPVRVDTDVNAAALGEWQRGAGQGCATLAYTTVGTGIGTGVVRGGVPLVGFSHFESGHIPVPRAADDSFAGICPYHGDCLEGLAAGPAISARFGGDLAVLADPAPAVALVAEYLSCLAASLVLLHAPDRLIFGGGVMKAPGLLAMLRVETARRLGGYVRHARLDPGLMRYIAAPLLGDDAGIVGALELARLALAERGAGDLRA